MYNIKLRRLKGNFLFCCVVQIVGTNCENAEAVGYFRGEAKIKKILRTACAFLLLLYVYE